MEPIAESIRIERSPEDVFAFFDNRTNDGRWMGAVEESEWLEPDESTELGRRGRMVMRAMGRQEFVDEVTEYEPGKRVAHRSESNSMVVHSSCAAEPEGNVCRATVTIRPERLPGGVFGALLAPIVRRKMRSDLKSDLARLKHLLEGDETPSP